MNAHDILVEALGENPSHADNCEARRFSDKNRFLPFSHPARRFCPPCSCWVGKAQRYLVEQAALENPQNPALQEVLKSVNINNQ